MIAHFGNIALEGEGYSNPLIVDSSLKNGGADVKLWLINIHICWDDRPMDAYYGFEIAREIRTKFKSKAPIVLYSPLPRSFFEFQARKSSKYGLLFAPGTYYWRMPFNEAALLELAEQSPQISEACLYDIQTSLCDLKGLVTERLNHDLKFDRGLEEVDRVFQVVENLLDASQQRLLDLEAFHEKLRISIADHDPNTYHLYKRQLVDLCNRHFSPEVGVSVEPVETKFKILIVDDQAAELQGMVDALGPSFSVVHTGDAEKAVALLKADTSNEILAVITDWRLYLEGSDTYWQTLQGYEILKVASETGFRGLISLTGQPDSLVHQLRNRLGFRFRMFKKESLLNDAHWVAMAEVIRESCEEALQVMAAQLDGADHWNRQFVKKNVPQPSLKALYLETWHSAGRSSFFDVEVGIAADEMWSHLEANPKHTLYKFNMKLPVHQSVLLPIMRFRRIYMALWYSAGIDWRRTNSQEISELTLDIWRRMFTPGDLHGRKDAKSSANRAVHFLCLSIDMLKEGRMLPEERQWLIRHGILQKAQ